jgi:hypothetical protein
MNCQDIARLLDGADLRLLPGPVAEEAATHRASCGACERDWNLQARLRALPDLAPPPGMAARMRAAVAEPAVRRRPVGIRHGVIASAIALAAAAAWLTLERPAGESTTQPLPPATDATEDAVAPANPEPPAPQVAVPQRPSIPAPAPATAPVAPADVEARDLLVAVLPMASSAQDAASQADADAFHAALVEQLRQMPGIAVMTVESRDGLTDAVAYLLEVSATPTARGLRVTIRAGRRGPDPLVQPLAAELESACASSSCFDGPRLAASMASMLRTMVFPVQPRTREAMAAQLADATASRDLRMQALRDLAAPRVSAAGASPRIARGAALEDADVVRNAIALAVEEPAHRAEIWRTLRGVRQPQLVEPLLAAALFDPDVAVRTEAVASLGAGFADDPRVHRELEHVAQQDSSLLVRALAQRTLTGEAIWRMHILATLQDASLPVEQRLEALTHHLDARGLAGPGDHELVELIDATAAPVLVEVLEAARDSGRAKAALPVVISRLGSIEDPAITAFLLDSFRRKDEFNTILVLNQLARRHSEPGVAALLQEVAGGSADARMRQIAAGALQQSAEQSAAAQQAGR